MSALTSTQKTSQPLPNPMLSTPVMLTEASEVMVAEGVTAPEGTRLAFAAGEWGWRAGWRLCVGVGGKAEEEGRPGHTPSVLARMTAGCPETELGTKPVPRVNLPSAPKVQKQPLIVPAPPQEDLPAANAGTFCPIQYGNVTDQRLAR